ncbi:MAG TPA: ATP-binding protein [Thermoanaerobaculia bacterium]|jgi:PAS domain S-box-containing protein|nr:ATP-binding protein [Thermoanaerobaculia bacterium]
MTGDTPERPIAVQGTEILPDDPPRLHRQKLARITLDSMVQFVGLLDAEGTVLEINKVALDAVGIQLADVEGKPFWTTFWWQVSEEINQGLRDGIARAAQGEFVRWDTPIYGRSGGTETIIIDASLMPVKDDDGKVVFIAAEGRDITEKKAQEREIAQKNIELQGLLERIRELDEIKTQFFANVSHELRTPLALILGPAQRLIDDDGTMALAERRESAQVVARNARMLLKHVHDLLDMSKIEANKLKIELADTDVAALVRFLASHFAALAADRNIDYQVDADDPLTAAVDADKLQRVLMNLLGNAFKFVPAGGRIRCSLRQTASEIVLSVDDSGPGVAPALRQAVFERFRQGDGGIDRKVGGTGLGLAIAKEFVEMHKGRIEVQDSDLGGARFTVTLPFHRLAETPPAPAAVLDPALLDGVLEELRFAIPTQRADDPPGPPVAGRARVLVVEDNPDMNRFVSQILGREYEVASAFDGREGLEQALRFRPTLIVTDIMMPNVSGVEMIAELRKLPELRTTPVLLLSAKADDELMVRLLDEGAQDFIVKPFSEKDLAVRVRNLVHSQQAREASAQSLSRELLARQEVELQKRLLHSLFMQAPTPIAVLRGPQHVIELANPPLCQIWGRAEQEVLNRPLAEVIPGLLDQIYSALLDGVYRTGIPYVGREVASKLGRISTGQPMYFNFVYSPFRNIEEEVEGIFIIASDVTAQVLAREQVEGLREAAESANRAKDEFLAMLGHELRNPLSPIVTALQLMKLQGPEGSEQARTIIERQVNHLIRLVDDLLDVSRIARGKVDLKRETVEIAEIVAKAIEMVSPLLEQQTQHLMAEVPRQGLAVDGDPIRLAQVVSNLLTNAAKYTPEAGNINVRARRDGGEVVLSVSDSGIGISSEMLPQVFDLFVQGRRGIDRSEGGLGLGLTIVRNLVERHGGSVSASSEGPGRGSEFLVRLPLAAGTQAVTDSSAAVAVATPEATPKANAQRILVVDDNEDGVATIVHILKLLGYDVRAAKDAPTALEIAADFLPKTALLDIGLPVMDGYELASRLRNLSGLADVRLIAITGYGQESDFQKTRDAGFHHHLVKPIRIEALEEALARVAETS